MLSQWKNDLSSWGSASDSTPSQSRAPPVFNLHPAALSIPIDAKGTMHPTDNTLPDASSNAILQSWFSQANEDPCFPKSLNKRQRIFGFFLSLLLGSLFISLAMIYLPVIVLKGRKFAVLYTMGSLCLLSSFCFLWGPLAHFKHLVSPSRLPFTTIYFLSMFATLYVAISLHSAVLSVIGVVVQVGALGWYLISYIPGGIKGMKFFGKMFYTAANRTVSALPL